MPRIRFPASCLVLLLLAACASAPPSDRIEDDRSVRLAVAATARTVALRDVDVVVHVGHAVRAELRPDLSLHVWRGLLLRTVDEGELAFALAHELAHHALAHPFPVAGAPRDVEQELAADARAREVLDQAGFDTNAGARLLQALRDEAAVADSAPAALAELDRRIGAFESAAAGENRRMDDPWRSTWRTHYAEWLAADPASGDPARLAAVARHARMARGDR